MDCLRHGFEPGKLLDGRFETISPLNHGSFGMVFAARDTFTGAEVAIKCITKPGAVKGNSTCPAAIAIDERSEELAIHSRLPTHPNIVNLIHSFETVNHQYMVLELCSNGDLYEAIRTGKGPLETEHVRTFMLELVDAVDHMHSHGVYHRDIKPENIFLTSEGSMKLGDFGLATADTWSTEFAVGSDRYMAPEQFDSSVYGYGYSPASADVWAIGIVLLNVLFQRNPFATPTMQDPLYADFVRDRQSLFDVFPNMSQDSYNVLVHSLALDPANRSLSAVREAVKAVVSFTTDDESLDEFCAAQSTPLVPVATAAREPLRTPSITTPDAGTDSYPWSSALLKTPQKATRQLSTIRDEAHELFPGSLQSEWQYVDTDEASLSSNWDSGLGMSYKSNKSAKSASTRATSDIACSLPISFSQPAIKFSPYGASGSGFSKSWSDLYDEEMELTEQQQMSSLEEDAEVERAITENPHTPHLEAITEDVCGSITPRAGLPRSDDATRATTPLAQLIEEDKKHEPSPKQRSASIMDRWAALGNFRRSKAETSPVNATPPPQKTRYADAFATITSFSANKKANAPAKPHDRATSWRQRSPTRLRATSMHNNRAWERKEHSPTAYSRNRAQDAWLLDNDWRQHMSPVSTNGFTSTQPVRSPDWRSRSEKKQMDNYFDDSKNDGDIEWVGGWRDFHL